MRPRCSPSAVPETLARLLVVALRKHAADEARTHVRNYLKEFVDDDTEPLIRALFNRACSAPGAGGGGGGSGRDAAADGDDAGSRGVAAEDASMAADDAVGDGRLRARHRTDGGGDDDPDRDWRRRGAQAFDEPPSATTAAAAAERYNDRDGVLDRAPPPQPRTHGSRDRVRSRSRSQSRSPIRRSRIHDHRRDREQGRARYQPDERERRRDRDRDRIGARGRDYNPRRYRRDDGGGRDREAFYTADDGRGSRGRDWQRDQAAAGRAPLLPRPPRSPPPGFPAAPLSMVLVPGQEHYPLPPATTHFVPPPGMAYDPRAMAMPVDMPAPPPALLRSSQAKVISPGGGGGGADDVADASRIGVEPNANGERYGGTRSRTRGTRNPDGGPMMPTKPRPPRTTLELQNVPVELNSIAKLNEYFGKFGELAHIQVGMGPQRRGAIIRYREARAAKAAISCPDAVLGNRFIRVHWAQEAAPADDSAIAAAAAELEKAPPTRAPDGAPGTAQQASEAAPSTPSQMPHSPVDAARPVKEILSIQQRQHALLDEQIAQQRRVLGRIESTSTPAQEKVQLRALFDELTKSIERTKESIAAGASATAAVAAAAMAGEAHHGGHGDAGRGGRGRMRGSAMHERGRGRGRGRGSGRGGAAGEHDARSADRRSRCLVVGNYDAADKDKLLAHFAKFGTVEAIAFTADATCATVTYKTRFEAENALKRAPTTFVQQKRLLVGFFEPQTASAAGEAPNIADPSSGADATVRCADAGIPRLLLRT